jgi:hypothetical protein
MHHDVFAHGKSALLASQLICIVRAVLMHMLCRS